MATQPLERKFGDADPREADPLYRLAQIVRLIQLYEQGRLPVTVMQALDDIRLLHAGEP